VLIALLHVGHCSRCMLLLVTSNSLNCSVVRRSCSCDSAYSYTFHRSVVCMSVVCLSHSYPLLKLFDGFRCDLSGTLVDSMTHCVRGIPDPQGKGRFVGRTPSQNMQSQIQIAAKPSVLCCHLANTK